LELGAREHATAIIQRFTSVVCTDRACRPCHRFNESGDFPRCLPSTSTAHDSGPREQFRAPVLVNENIARHRRRLLDAFRNLSLEENNARVASHGYHREESILLVISYEGTRAHAGRCTIGKTKSALRRTAIVRKRPEIDLARGSSLFFSPEA
jgi:hypothetical protein